MEELLNEIGAEIKTLVKHLTSKETDSVSDKATHDHLINLTATWHQQVKPGILRFIPISDEIYELENTLDRLADYTTGVANRKEVIKDVRAFGRRLEKHVRIPLIKCARSQSANDESTPLINPDNFKNPRKYLTETIRQINLTYSHLCPDACAFLMRKAVEFMLIDYYHINNRMHEISDASGRVKHLKTIINHFISNSGVNPNDMLRNFLQNARIFGGTAAHNARIILLQEDVEKLAATVELALRELHGVVYPTT